MAAAAPSPLASSVEKTNGAKLSRLLIDGGTTVLRNVFDTYHPPANLAADLNANYLTLNNLLRRRVLHTAQWDQLFPPGGAAPDSNTFDITLLFLLLTNICVLAPPPSGWHSKPPPSDRSLEANLARIKCFRNELYGHVSTTGVDAPTFNSLWLEISAVLVALGLNQAEIDRLKAEHCGEEDYLDVLLDWAGSEEDVKSQLKELRQCHTETQQDVGKVFQIQMEDRKTREGTKFKLNEVHQTQTNIQGTIEKVRQTQLEDHETLENSKSELADVHQTQTNIQGTVERLRQTQLGDHETLQDSKSKLDEVHQTQTKIQETTERVRQTQLEDRETLQGNKSKLDKVNQTQAKTQETTERVRQTQIEDHKTLQESKLKLDEVHQTQDKTQETTERVRHTQLEDHETLQDSKSKLDDLHHTQAKTQEIVQGVVKTQEEHFEALQAVKQTVDSLKNPRDEDREEEVLRSLVKSEFKRDIEYHVGRFQEGTREWVFNKVQNWLDDRTSQNRVMVITANAGMGKSVIAAVICQRMQEAGRLSGSHFCQHNNARYRNPQLMLQSLACHLCHALPEYKQALVKQLSRNLGKDLKNMGVEELFALLFKEPLSTVADPGRNMLMVIDGLDESEYQERNDLLDVIANHFCKLPYWIRFLCTTRPERNIAVALKQLKPFQLEPNEEENVQDIKLFLEKGTQQLTREGKKDAIVEKLVEKSEGLMLYAYFLVLFLKENMSILDQGDLDGSLPLAISSVYYSYFKRLENELVKELGVTEEQFLNLLCAVTASREPLPIDFVSKVLVPSANSPVARRKVLKAIGSVSSLLPIRDGCLHIFHKSVNDWLTDISSYGEHDFTVDEKEGHHILASLCSDELDDLKQKVVRDTLFSTTEKYALHHGVRHMLLLDEDMKSGSLEKCVQTYVIDLELLYAKLCINDSLAAEDILWLQSHEISQSLSEDSKALLSTLTILLRKYFNTITNHPLVFFQTVLNEGGTVLSSMASNLLQNKYLDIPYMEFVHKQVQQGGVLARFQCSSQVACFDVSPQLDYMVCECRDETIQLWSLDTGKLVWTHPVMVKKPYIFGTFRRSISSPVFSLYRSVVFHPTAAVVLPGVLSHAYTFDGNLKLLFPESKCRFTVCSISGDKIKMLTDCPDDAKCILMWSLESGSEIFRITRIEDVLSFAWSRDEKLLAISHCTGSICFADVEDGGRILVQTVTPEVCGMIKFSPDCKSLFCCHLSLSDLKESLFRLSINMAEHVTCWSDVLGEYYMYLPWEFESQSIGGFLLGDPLTSLFDTSSLAVFDWTFDFVLNKQTVLRGYPQDVFIDMLNINELRPLETDKKAKPTSIKEIVFSLSGETIYTVSKDAVTKLPTARAWNVTSWKHIAKKSIEKIEEKRWSPWFRGKATYLVAVNKGILLTTRMGALEMWNFKLSNCVRCWTDLCGITQMIPISEERVACVASLEYGKKVIILDTTSGEIMSEISIGYSNFIACNSKCEVLTWKSRSFELLHGSTTVWEKYLRFSRHRVSKLTPDGMFSPKGRFVITWAMQLMYVLDAVSGKPLHILCSGPFLDSDCKFISDEECVISFITALRGYCLRLFNVKSGDLLSVIDLERQVDCLAACPRKRLLAIGQKHSKHGFQLIQVRLPQDKDSRESKSMASTAVIEEKRENKRMANTPETKDSTDNERGLDNLDVLEGKQATGTSLKRREESPSYSSSKRSKLTPDHPAVAVIKEGTPENADLERLAQ